MIVFPGAVIGGYSAKAVTYDGSNDYLSKSSVTGLSNGTIGLLSFWFRIDEAPATGVDYFVGNGRFRVNITSTPGDVYIVGIRTTGASCLSMHSAASKDDGAWHHFLAVWDLSASALCKIYVDDVDETTILTRTNDAIDYTNTNFAIGRFHSGGGYVDGDLAEFYFTTEWLDITDSANRQKFARNGKPFPLGSDGSRPTGTAPLIYLKGPAANWGTNAGSGGDFTVHGTFTDAATKPSY